MMVHAAFGGSTNLLLHLTAIAHAAGLRRPTVDDWTDVNRRVPRIVDVLPNGPRYHPTVRVFMAGGVPEVMLHLRRLGLLELGCLTASGETLGRALDWWESSERRRVLRERLRAQDGVDPDDVIMSPEQARARGLTSTITFPRGNLAPEGSVIKSTAIDPTVVDADGVYRKTGPARVFTTERAAIAAIKSTGPERVKAGDVLVLICRGPLGTGMEEIYQITAALKHLSFGKHVAVLTDARFSGVSTGACIGHVGPEALAGGPIGKVVEGDRIRIVIDRNRLEGSIDLVGHGDREWDPAEGARVLAGRPSRPDLAPDPDLPPDTRLWAALQAVGGGTWGGCVYDVDAITEVLAARDALRRLDRRRPLGGLLFLGTLTVLWGSNWPAMKLALRELDPWTFRTVCLLVGGGGLLALVARAGRASACRGRSAGRSAWSPSSTSRGGTSARRTGSPWSRRGARRSSPTRCRCGPWSSDACSSASGSPWPGSRPSAWGSPAWPRSSPRRRARSRQPPAACS